MKIESPHNICIWSQIIQLAGSLDTLRGIFANMYWTFGAAPPPRELMWLSETARAEYQPDSVNRSVWYTPCIDFCRTPISLPTAPTTLCMRNPLLAVFKTFQDFVTSKYTRIPVCGPTNLSRVYLRQAALQITTEWSRWACAKCRLSKSSCFHGLRHWKIIEPSITTKDISTGGVALHNVYFVRYIFCAT